MVDELSDEDAAAPSAKATQKQARIARDRAALLQSLRAHDFSSLKNRVAAILNLFPKARDSDVTLTLKYWESFQPEIYRPDAIAPSDLFRLERFHLIVRARALIQNEYGLFVASENTKRYRKKNEKTIKAEVLADPAERSVFAVFADETGKTAQYAIVAAVWVLSGYEVFRVTRAIEAWHGGTPAFAKREMHFTRLGRNDAECLRSYLDVIASNRELLSFKIIGIERSKTRRSIQELFLKLYGHMLKSGMEHEVTSGRMSLPRSASVTIDAEDSLDPIALSELKDSVQVFAANRFGVGAIDIEDVGVVSSRHSPLLQLADVIAGAVGRKLNHDGERNFKDEFADEVIRKLGLVVEESENDAFDSSAFLPL